MAGACHPQHLRAILNIIRGCSGDYDLQTQCMYMDSTHTSRERHEHQGSATHKGMRTKALSTKWACASATVCQLLNLNVVTFQWFTAQPLLTNRLFCNYKRQMSNPPPRYPYFDSCTGQVLHRSFCLRITRGAC